MFSESGTRVAAVQMNTGADVGANLARAGELIGRAVDAGAGLVVLPEVFAFIGRSLGEQLTICEDDGSGPIQDFLAEQSRSHRIWLAGGTFPLRSPQPDRVYAACGLYGPQGKCAALYRKLHLFDVHLRDSGESYSESSTFARGDEVVVIDTPFGRCGLAVCYDLRFPEMFRLMLNQGAELILLPSAFTAATGRVHWSTLLRARAVENLAFVVAANQTGRHANGRSNWGHSMVIDPWGTSLAGLGAEEGVAVAGVDRTLQARLRSEFPCLEHRRIECDLPARRT